MERPLPAGQHCRHYSYESGMRGGPLCALAIDLTPPRAVLACMPTDEARPSCAKREEHTDTERQAWQEWRKARMARMVTILAEIPGSSGDRNNRPHWGKSGVFDCPGCGTGTVRWTRSSYNGHLHAGCSTPNCFGVME